MKSTIAKVTLGMTFFLPNCDVDGTQPNVTYTCTDRQDGGIYATGLRTFEGNSIHNPFWLPDFTEIDLAD
jgi:hypothetical protein